MIGESTYLLTKIPWYCDINNNTRWSWTTPALLISHYHVFLGAKLLYDSLFPLSVYTDEKNFRNIEKNLLKAWRRVIKFCTPLYSIHNLFFITNDLDIIPISTPIPILLFRNRCPTFYPLLHPFITHLPFPVISLLWKGDGSYIMIFLNTHLISLFSLHISLISHRWDISLIRNR